VAARRTQAGPATSYALVIAAGAVLGAGAATYFGVPGAPIVWVALMVAGWLEQVPMFTGKKDQRGFPTPSHPGEQKAMNTYRFWKDLRWRLVCPTTDWLPGWPVLGSWLAALLAGALFTFAPVRPGLPPALAWVNAACAFIVVAQVLASRRRTVAEDDQCPGARVDSVPALLTDKKEAIALAAAVAAAAGAVAYAGAALVPQWVALTGPLGAVSPWAFGGLISLAAAGAVAGHPLQASALATWRELVGVRRQWSPRWVMLKMDPPPFMVGHRTVGPAVVDTFDAPPSMGAAAFYLMASKITPTLGTNMRVAVLETPNQDGQGQPVPGTCHPLRFEVVMWPTDQIPDITAPGTEPAVAELLIRCAMGWAADAGGFARFVLTGCDLVTAPDAAAVWATQWATTSDLGLNYIRNNARGDLAGGLSADVLVDHRAMGGAGLMLVGPALDPSTEFSPDSGLTTKAVAQVAEEDEWRRRWAGTLKQGVNAPVPQFEVKAEGELADGTKVFYQPFVTLTGEDPAQFMTGLEAKMAATILGSASFVSIARYSVRGTARAGERHSQALTVAYSLTPVPPVNKMAPVRGEAPKWVLAGHINSAFTAARLTRPEVLSVQCLTLATSREHIWQINVRLFDVTLSDVRGAAARIKGSLGAGIWLRIATHPEGCTIYAGGFPAKVKLARPERDTPRLVALDWEQAWLDSKVSGVNAQLPALTNVGSLPKNDQVQVLDFDLPPGIAMGDIKDATDKLRTATANSFIDVREGVNGAASVRLLVCEVSPMPTFAPFDFAEIDSSTAIPFATGVEGEAVCYDFLRDPHLLVVGGTGSGKAQPLDSRLPVPVSNRFPDGWALNGELAVGDEVYTAGAQVTTILGFTEARSEAVYVVTLSDGQRVRASASHLWTVTDRAARRSATSSLLSARSAWREQVWDKAARLDALAARIGPEVGASLADISVLAGFDPLYLACTDFVPEGLGRSALIKTRKSAHVYEMGTVLRYMKQTAARRGVFTLSGTRLTVQGIDDLQLDGTWLSARTICEAIMGRTSTRAERDLVKQVISRSRPARADGVERRLSTVFPTDEVLTLVASRLRGQVDAKRAAADEPTRIVTTAEMLDGLRNGLHANFSLPVVGAPDAPDAALPIPPYLLGAWLGDGTSATAGITVGGTDLEETTKLLTEEWAAPERVDGCSSSDAMLLHFGRRLPALCDHGHDDWHTYPNGRRQCRACEAGKSARDGSNRSLGRALGALGVTNNKHIPALYRRASTSQRLALLQGLMDTDGTVDKVGSCELSLCDERLSRDALELIRSLGIKASMVTAPASITEPDSDRPGHRRMRVTGTRWRIHFTTTTPVFRLQRKAARLPLATRSTAELNYVTEVTVEGVAPQRCIRVASPDHTYLTEDFVPTHNSATLQALIYAALVLGCDMYIADPTKGGADFQFAMPWVKSFTTDVYDAAAMMNGVYAEVQRRKNLNAAHGVGSYLELPDGIRPPHAVIVLDEFTSLMMTDQLQKPDLEDEEAVREYESLQALNSAKQLIGSKSGRIAREARSAGMTLLLATQRLTAKTLEAIPGAQDLRSNMSRLILGKATLGELQSALKDPYSAPPMGDSVPRGRGLLEVSGERVQLVQSWYVQDIQSVLAAHLTERRQPLDPSERIDLTPFMPRRPEHERPDDRHAPAAPVVVELDDLEMSLDDLATGDDEVGAELPAWAAEFAAVRALDTEPDVDPFRDVEAKDDAAPGAPAARPDVVLFGDALGRVCETLVPTGRDLFGWWKVDAILAWLDEHPAVTRVVFADDELDDVDELDTPHRDVLAEVLDTRGVEHLLLAAAGGVLSPGELTDVAAFLGEEPVDDAIAEALLAEAFTADLDEAASPEPIAVLPASPVLDPADMALAPPIPRPRVTDVPASAFPEPQALAAPARRLTAPVPDEW
jgi:hypothetical protein